MTMEHPTQQPRVAIRAALQAAGILTETGDIRGVEADRPDARLIALVEQYNLAWTTYIVIQRKGRKKPGEKATAHEHYEAADAIPAQVAAIPATTIEGARAKAQLAIDRTLGNINAVAVSALRDALRGPAPLIPPATGKRRRSRQQASAVVLTPPDDGALLALIDEYGDPLPAKPPKFPFKPPANSPPRRKPKPAA
jgi:hypothetical protein